MRRRTLLIMNLRRVQVLRLLSILRLQIDHTEAVIFVAVLLGVLLGVVPPTLACSTAHRRLLLLRGA
jgi:hypothetical protein